MPKPTATTDPNPLATATEIRERGYLTLTIIRHVHGKQVRRDLDTRWTSRQRRWCDKHFDCTPEEMMVAGTSRDNARVRITPDTFIAWWGMARAACREATPDIEDLLDLRDDQVNEQFDIEDVVWHTPDGEDNPPADDETEGGGPDDPTESSGVEP